MAQMGHFHHQIQPAYSFLILRSLRLKTLATNPSPPKKEKNKSSIIPADSCVQSWISFFLEKDLMSTFAQMPHTPRYLQQQIHQTLQLTHTPPSVPSLQLYLHLSEKHRGKPKKTGVNENEQHGSAAAFFLILPFHCTSFPAPVLLSSSTLLNAERTKARWTVLIRQQDKARLPAGHSSETTGGAVHVAAGRAGFHRTANAHLVPGSCSRVPRMEARLCWLRCPRSLSRALQERLQSSQRAGRCPGHEGQGVEETELLSSNKVINY